MNLVGRYDSFLMKYYVYLSDSKLEMLCGQLKRDTDQVREASLGFDIKVLKGELKEGRKLSETKFSRLEAVLSQLRSSDLVGNLWDTKPYIQGKLTMIWASFADYFGAGDAERPPITFWGYVDERIALGLAGSSYHVLGEARPDGHAHSDSGTDAITRWLIKHFDDAPRNAPYQVDDPYNFRRMRLDSEGVSMCTWLAVSNITGTSHRFEFVAKVLNRSRFDPATHPNRTTNVILATPIYVAQLD